MAQFDHVPLMGEELGRDGWDLRSGFSWHRKHTVGIRVQQIARLDFRIPIPAATTARNPMAEPPAASQYSLATQYPNIARKAPATIHSGAVGQRSVFGASPTSWCAIAAGGTAPST